ncbi:MAG: hypothetical protein IPG87_09975 [Saprospiraceae bacterium]|nr:hypothetical protein [Candidatus Vicinibacter affinis]
MVQTDNGILSELGFMGLLGVVGRIIISFEFIEDVIFLTMDKIPSSRSH